MDKVEYKVRLDFFVFCLIACSIIFGIIGYFDGKYSTINRIQKEAASHNLGFYELNSSGQVKFYWYKQPKGSNVGEQWPFKG